MMREMADYQKPREKMAQLGGELLRTEEVLAILLRTGCKGKSVLDVAKEALALIEGEKGLFTVQPEDLMSIRGIGKDKAITICAAIELGRRLSQLKVKKTFSDFSQPSAVANYMMERLRHMHEEHFVVAMLNTKNKLLKVETISRGGLSSSLAEQRTVFRKAIKANAASIILIHNHPSGDSTPSPDDIRVTKVFIEAGKVMGIPVLDHIVIGDGEYVSLCERGYI